MAKRVKKKQAKQAKQAKQETKRRPYVPPAILEDETFERSALSTCSKQDGICPVPPQFFSS